MPRIAAICTGGNRVADLDLAALIAAGLDEGRYNALAVALAASAPP